MKLFTIGDSVAQGFMSMAAARTELSFSTRIQHLLDPNRNQVYNVPKWPLGGHPIDVEAVLRKLDARLGPNIAGPIDWARALFFVQSMMDDVETYYERGEGAENEPYPGGVSFFHNCAVRGFNVADAWLVTPAVCRDFIRNSDQKNSVFGLPSASFHRTAARVLNPSGAPAFEHHSALSWLSHHAKGEGVENALICLGANNVLEVVTRFRTKRTPNDANNRPHQWTHRQRFEAGYNIWHPDDFEAEYAELVARTSAAMQPNKYGDWRVFVANVPFVTIAPLAKGVGQTFRVRSAYPNINDKLYFKYYTYFPFEESDINQGVPKLRFNEALQIDEFIARYNESIERVVEGENSRLGAKRFFVVDIESALTKLAWKRNGGMPTYKLPGYLNDLMPRPSTLFYHASRERKLEAGGIFSLDGVHPSSIGQGLLAREFLEVMQKAGVVGARPDDLDWARIVREDRLYMDPLRVMSELRENKDLIQWFLDVLNAW